ncbi:MAG: carboxypeptidase-like regulatory domain-containing protein [Bacteroidetes bacterium]|nr:carboxypeptidase-like regulatory domain-containing protein [Bacteroidota bacterium]
MKRSTTQRSLFKGQCMLLAKFLLVGIFLISQLGAFAQQKNITGIITGKDGKPIPGVTVIFKGTTAGTVTDIDGNYSITNVPDDATLVFSFVGMKTQEIKVVDQNIINITLAVDAIGLDEVVAIGYGTARKKDLTGSVVNVNAEQLMKYKPSSVSDLLRSSVAGLKVGYSTNARATPDFFIRGDNTIKADANDERSAINPTGIK